MSVQITCLLFLSCCSFFLAITQSTPCLDHQKLLLLALKNNLTFDSSLSTKLVGWNRTVECCVWPGVTCDDDGHVTGLDLSHETIRGIIPSSQIHWERLDHLEFLNIGYNSLTGNLPDSILTLPSLQYLDLSNNKLSGHFTDPSSRKLRLRNIDLSSNSFEGPIPEFVYKLVTLSTLTLSSNRFTGSVELDKFGTLTELYSLDLSYNNLTVTISANFSLLSKLNTIKLASCRMYELPDLKNQSKLLMLDLSNNQLTGEIPNWIWELGNGYLRFLNMSHNKFTRLEKPYTFPFLLDVLDLHSNRLQGDIPVPPRRVYHLDYSNNCFKSSIPVNFGNVITSTLFFSVSNNNLVGVIPDSIRNASKMRVLNLSRNGFTGSIPLIGNLKDLQSLDLSVNLLNGSIPQELTDLTQLMFLNLSYNHLSGRIPQGLINFTELAFEGNEGLCGVPLKKSCHHVATKTAKN